MIQHQLSVTKKRSREFNLTLGYGTGKDQGKKMFHWQNDEHWNDALAGESQ
jgi:hypothetical protein